MIIKIISSGQTSVDRAALDVAIKLDIPHGGWFPKGSKALDGKFPGEYQLEEISNSSDLECAEKNIENSDGTLIITQGELTGDTAGLFKMATELKRPCLHIDLNTKDDFVTAQTISAWITTSRIEILNIAGSRETDDPNRYKIVSKILNTVLYLDMMGFSLHRTEHALNQSPKTVEEAASSLISKLSAKDKFLIAYMKLEDLNSLQSNVGEFIRNNFGLTHGNNALIESCRQTSGDPSLHEESAAMVIIEAAWNILKETHRLRVLK